tara:strand:+ start:593 stop:859 length:267 start_codon:yes stop_codon:yes gene_type:complete
LIFLLGDIVCRLGFDVFYRRYSEIYKGTKYHLGDEVVLCDTEDRNITIILEHNAPVTIAQDLYDKYLIPKYSRPLSESIDNDYGFNFG